MQTIPCIPDSAPFTPAQRSWLNGFFAGLYSNAAAPAQPVAAALKVTVLHASQTGTGEGLARKVAKELKAKGHTATVTSLEAFTPAALAAEQHAILIASTYGEGDPPDAAKPFFQQLSRSDAPRLDSLAYSVLALGDKNYEQFCKFGCDLDHRLQALGAQPLAPRVDCDVDLDEPFTRWKTALLARLDAIAGGAETSASTPTAPAALREVTDAPTHSRANPFLAELIDQRPLTCAVSSKLTVHLSFSLAGGTLAYQAGDALGVIARNDPRLVEEILAAAALPADAPVQLATLGGLPLADALAHHLQITRLTRRIIESFALHTQAKPLLTLLAPGQEVHLDEFCHGRGLIDLLLDYPGAIPSAADLAALLPRLAPRLYSISSSPAAHGSEVHTTVAVVRYRSHNRERAGVASTMLSGRMAVGDRQPVYIQPNPRFRLPANPAAPIVMIGPGTGIAPFRAFLHERRALAATGRNWLFFGERSAATDFLYRDELQSMQADGHLTRLDLAFSRDQERKVYVQDRMAEHAAELYRWLRNGATLYVCGDASRMARDVDATLHRIVEQQSGLSKDDAGEYVQQLKDEHRYHRDIY